MGVESEQIFKKKFKIPKKPKIVSKSVHTCSEHALGRFYRIFFCQVFHAGLFSFSGLKIKSLIFQNNFMSSVLRHTTQQILFLHSRHSQFTQSHFRCSGLKNVSSDSRTQKYEFSFPDKKNWVQLYGLKFWGRGLDKN